jgi:hypothetical protein
MIFSGEMVQVVVRILGAENKNFQLLDRIHFDVW